MNTCLIIIAIMMLLGLVSFAWALYKAPLMDDNGSIISEDEIHIIYDTYAD